MNILAKLKAFQNVAETIHDAAKYTILKLFLSIENCGKSKHVFNSHNSEYFFPTSKIRQQKCVNQNKGRHGKDPKPTKS